MKTLIEQFKRARQASTPLMAISTPDPAATIQSIVKANTNGNTVPLIQWDCVCGAIGINEEGAKEIAQACGDLGPEDVTSPVEILTFARALQNRAILFMLNGHQYFDQPTFIQAFWNLRDVFSNANCTVVLLGPAFTMPPELQQDTLLLDEPLPNAEQLREIVSGLTTRNKIPNVDDEVLEKAVDALRGLAAFPADQNAAMNASKKNGLDIDGMWERKRQMIKQTDGLSVWSDGLRFSDLEGIDEIERMFRRIIAGKASPKLIVWLDEVEKIMAGAAGSASGFNATEQDQLGILLSEMQDRNYSGAILVGVPGAGKSAFAKSVGAEAGVLTIRLDLGGAKGSGLVGQAENSIRNVMKIIHAVGGDGGAFFIATSNDIRVIKPELKRRFKKGIWFFDLPEKKEREKIWQLYLKKYAALGLKATSQKIDFDEGWTGAEIESCVSTAWEECVPLAEAARSIIPVSVSGKEDIARLRREADGRYNAVNHAGVYKSIEPVKLAQTSQTAAGRTIVDEA